MNSLSVVYKPTADLKPSPNNARTHSKRQVEQIAAAIERFGFTNPVLLDDGDSIVCGHGRVEAARLLALKEVPTIRLGDMSPADIRAYRIADNRLAEKAGWDGPLLKTELTFLSELEVDFDLTLTGFDLREIEGMLAGDASAGREDDAADKPVTVSGDPPVTKTGDIWEIGKHRLICGDATEYAIYETLLGDDKADMVFCDSPFNVPIAGHVSGLGKSCHREFQMASGEMSPDEFAQFLFKSFSNLAKASRNGSIHFQCMDWRHIGEMMQAGLGAYSELKNLCVWSKTNGGMGSLYRSAHELVFVFKSGTAPHTNNVELGKHGRFRTNVWQYPGCNAFGADRDAELEMHPTVKPVTMVLDAMLDCSNRGDIVLDAFAGSGTTLVAAQKARRRGYGIEIDPVYCDTIIRRMRGLFKLDALLANDGRTFDDIALQRGAEPREIAA